MPIPMLKDLTRLSENSKPTLKQLDEQARISREVKRANLRRFVRRAYLEGQPAQQIALQYGLTVQQVHLIGGHGE